jgi:transcriptional regulator with XRE-family HTH domain
VDTWQVRVHDLIARGVAEARQRKGWTQEQTAIVFRSHGLRAWRKGTVGQLEAGLRKPRLDEVLLMARALEVKLDQLIPGGDDERVELGDDAEVSPLWIREMITGVFWEHLIEGRPYERFPVDDVLAEVLGRAQAEEKNVMADMQPIIDWDEQHDRKLRPKDLSATIYARASDTEQHAAQRLGVKVPRVKLAARYLWDGRDFDEERDRRVGDIDALEPRSRQARRGLVTRQMLSEHRPYHDMVYGGQGKGDSER